jgi:hypothetical protein
MPWEDLLAWSRRTRRPRSRPSGSSQARPGISSQLIDNLNANIHLRALLTDLFLVDDLIDQR